MPIEGSVLGFSNKWYSTAFKTARNFEIDSDLVIRLITPECFLATKLDAFYDRGTGNFLLSNDIEDILTLINWRVSLTHDVAASVQEVKQYVVEQFKVLLLNTDFLEDISGHLDSDNASQSRRSLIIARMQAIADLKL